MYRVKIYGAGSVGNHLAHAARRMGWSVTVCDTSETALERMKTEIYPRRYGAWDDGIDLCPNDRAPRGGFDFVFLGTPPDTHLALALAALEEKPRALLIEKPLCPPTLEGLGEFVESAGRSSTRVYVGYNHVVGAATRQVEALLGQGVIGDVQAIDVEFREHWSGIFKAHPWLRGPEDTYLGFWQRGGGASGEHSHALNLWQHFAQVVGAGRVVEVGALLRYVTSGRARYDDICLLQLETEHGLVGRVVQDVVTTPPRKRARLHGERGTIEWIGGYSTEGDAVIVHPAAGAEAVHLVRRTRPDDFLEEMKFLDDQLGPGPRGAGLDLGRGVDTMLLLAAAHRGQREKGRMRIDYGRRVGLEAISPCRTGAGGGDE